MLRHDAFWVTVALAGHGLGLAFVATLPSARPAPHDADATVVDLELPAEQKAEVAAEENDQVAPDSAEVRRRETLPDRSQKSATAAAAPPRPRADDDAIEATVPAEAPSVGTLRQLSNDQLGIGSRNVLLEGALRAGSPSSSVTPPEADVARERNVAPGVQESLRTALREHDLALGIGSGGPLVGIIEETTRTSDTPWESSATFQVSTDASGHVTGIRISSVSSSMEGWKRVARQILDALRERTLRVPSGAAGIVVTLRVTSESRLPSGSRARYEPHVGDTSEVASIERNPAPSGAASAATAQAPAGGERLDVLKVDPHVEQTTPQSDKAVNLKLPEQRASAVDIVNAPFDVTDIGARPMRVVHARIVNERPL